MFNKVVYGQALLRSPTPLPFYVPFLAEKIPFPYTFHRKNGDMGLNTLMTPRYLNLFLDVRLATFHLSPQILTLTLPCVTCGLMRKKCKDMVVNFWKYQPTVITPIQLNGIVIDRVSSYKLLGVIISDDLSWNEHCDSILKKSY